VGGKTKESKGKEVLGWNAGGGIGGKRETYAKKKKINRDEQRKTKH